MSDNGRVASPESMSIHYSLVPFDKPTFSLTHILGGSFGANIPLCIKCVYFLNFYVFHVTVIVREKYLVKMYFFSKFVARNVVSEMRVLDKNSEHMWISIFIQF